MAPWLRRGVGLLDEHSFKLIEGHCGRFVCASLWCLRWACCTSLSMAGLDASFPLMPMRLVFRLLPGSCYEKAAVRFSGAEFSGIWWQDETSASVLLEVFARRADREATGEGRSEATFFSLECEQPMLARADLSHPPRRPTTNYSNGRRAVSPAVVGSKLATANHSIGGPGFPGMCIPASLGLKAS